jgi:biopolymer transport protein ExbD
MALVLVPLSVLGIWAGWYCTRSWEPVNMPISLGRGHIQAGFEINVESTYAIELHFSSNRVLERHPCPNDSMACDSVSLAGAPWSVSTAGKRFASGRGQPELGDYWERRSIGAFQCGKGHYVLDIDPVEDQSRLNFYQPRLVIFEVGGRENSDGSLWVAALSLLALLWGGPVGASMTILAAVHWRQEKLASWWKTYPLNQAGPVPSGERAQLTYGKTIAMSRRKKPVTPRPFARFSQTSLVLVLTLFIVWVSMVVGTSLELIVPSGLPIHVIRPGVTIPRSPGIQPLRVSVRRDGRNSRPILYVDSQLVAWEDFGALLKKELARRPPDWPVYVEGDPDVEWRQVAEAIDAIRGEQGEVVLLTGAAKSQ